MSDIPNDGKPGFVAEKPEHCFACYRLIRPGQTHYLTIEGIVHCEDCALSEDVIPVRGYVVGYCSHTARSAAVAGTESPRQSAPSRFRPFNQYGLGCSFRGKMPSGQPLP